MRTQSKRGGAVVKRIRSLLRYDHDSPMAPSLTCDESVFGRAMRKYMHEANRPYPTYIEVLGVLMSLGYRDKEFALRADEFCTALRSFKKSNRRPFPLWSEVLGVALACGWHKPEPPPDRKRGDGDRNKPWPTAPPIIT